jgi:hypothetical protein
MDMLVDRAFCSWLGGLDSRVATGGETGGTHDLRLGYRGVEREITRFVGVSPRDGRWVINLAPYPAYGLGEHSLTIALYGGRRSGECAMPRQYGGTPAAYPLWYRANIRPYRRGAPEAPHDAILLLHDTDGRFHARVVHREEVSAFPERLRTALERFSERGQCVEFAPPVEIIDLPKQRITRRERSRRPEVYVRDSQESENDLKTRLQRLRGAAGKEPAGQRHCRSRHLAETLKQLYEYQCQVCDAGSLRRMRIPMAGGRYYCEVHHIDGFAESDASQPAAASQEDATLSIDRPENLIVVCPFHHMFLHHRIGGFEFDRARLVFVAPDGLELQLMRNKHLPTS